MADGREQLQRQMAETMRHINNEPVVRMRDRLHQPYRLPLFPAGATLLDVAMQSGALGAFVSGAGPSILALCSTPAEGDAVAAALEAAAQASGINGAVLRLAISEQGAHVVG